MVGTKEDLPVFEKHKDAKNKFLRETVREGIARIKGLDGANK